MNSTLYELLEVPATAGEDTIRQALTHKQRFWSKRASNAPSRDARHEAEQKMSELSEARRVLLDPQARAAYDAGLSGGPGSQPGPAPFAPQPGPSPAPFPPAWSPAPQPSPAPPIWPQPSQPPPSPVPPSQPVPSQQPVTPDALKRFLWGGLLGVWLGRKAGLPAPQSAPAAPSGRAVGNWRFWVGILILLGALGALSPSQGSPASPGAAVIGFILAGGLIYWARKRSSRW
jgi:hypothetical protein